MQKIHEHRGFAITILVEDDPTGGSSVTTRIDRIGVDGQNNPEWTAPRLSRSGLRGHAAIGQALDDAQRAIDSALGADDVLEK